MSDFSKTELRRLDLTLLLVFLGLLRHRKARLVAEDLGLTQSAISQALRRLRDIFQDELFLRRPHGLDPTAMALALEAPVTRAIEALQSALGDTRAFDPAEATGVVRIAALDAEQAVLVPPLAARLRAKAPRLRMSVLPLGRRDMATALEDGRAELALGFWADVAKPICDEVLYKETFLVAGTSGSLPDAPSVNLDTYCASEHILVSPGGDLHGIVDTKLEALGRSRHITLGLPAFLPALAAAAQSGALVTIPSRIARTFAPGFGLTIADPPLKIRGFSISSYWHRRNNNDPRTDWLREQIRDQITGQP
ncbi:MAG: LysR substrate-binding domain-containing protein [Pseudomonadota bacterium]